jgi:hypothetical protein
MESKERRLFQKQKACSRQRSLNEANPSQETAATRRISAATGKKTNTRSHTEDLRRNHIFTKFPENIFAWENGLLLPGRPQQAQDIEQKLRNTIFARKNNARLSLTSGMAIFVVGHAFKQFKL